MRCKFYLTNIISNFISGTKSYTIKLKDSTKTLTTLTSAKIDLNDCLLESENFQITKSDNNKYLLLPVKKSDDTTEKFVLKECGKDISETQVIFFFLHYTHKNIQKPKKYSIKTHQKYTRNSSHLSFFFFISSSMILFLK